MTHVLQIQTPRWAIPLLDPAPIKGAKGGRSSGKSHFFGEGVVEQHIINPDFRTVCVREVQKSLKHSAKALIEGKIRSMGVSHLFDITLTEIRRIDGNGLIIFQGLQDHTADSIKSLEDFDLAWVEEAQSISARSLELLIPTIRKDGSEIWFSWNPEKPDDPVEKLFAGRDDAILVHVDYLDNPFCPQKMIDEAERMRLREPLKYQHIWRGQFDSNPEKQVFKNWKLGDLDHRLSSRTRWLQGMDWGFSIDPSVFVRFCKLDDETLYIRNEVYIEQGTATQLYPSLLNEIEGAKDWQTIADSARPEMVDFMRREWSMKMISARKGKGSVEDGVTFLQSMNVVIHPSCVHCEQEFTNYSYKTDKRTGEIMPLLEDKHNHAIDAIRYGAEGMHRKGALIDEQTAQRERARGIDYSQYDFDDEGESWKTV